MQKPSDSLAEAVYGDQMVSPSRLDQKGFRFSFIEDHVVVDPSVFTHQKVKRWAKEHGFFINSGFDILGRAYAEVQYNVSHGIGNIKTFYSDEENDAVVMAAEWILEELNGAQKNRIINTEHRGEIMSEATNDEELFIEWGSWECPNCDEQHEDPEDICETTCRHCQSTVVLSSVDEYGEREAKITELKNAHEEFEN